MELAYRRRAKGGRFRKSSKRRTPPARISPTRCHGVPVSLFHCADSRNTFETKQRPANPSYILLFQVGQQARLGTCEFTERNRRSSAPRLHAPSQVSCLLGFWD